MEKEMEQETSKETENVETEGVETEVEELDNYDEVSELVRNLPNGEQIWKLLEKDVADGNLSKDGYLDDNSKTLQLLTQLVDANAGDEIALIENASIQELKEKLAKGFVDVVTNNKKLIIAGSAMLLIYLLGGVSSAEAATAGEFAEYIMNGLSFSNGTFDIAQESIDAFDTIKEVDTGQAGEVLANMKHQFIERVKDTSNVSDDFISKAWDMIQRSFLKQ